MAINLNRISTEDRVFILEAVQNRVFTKAKERLMNDLSLIWSKQLTALGANFTDKALRYKGHLFYHPSVTERGKVLIHKSMVPEPVVIPLMDSFVDLYRLYQNQLGQIKTLYSRIFFKSNSIADVIELSPTFLKNEVTNIGFMMGNVTLTQEEIDQFIATNQENYNAAAQIHFLYDLMGT